MSGKDIPNKFFWLKKLIYVELNKNSGTVDIATQIAAKYLEDKIRSKKFNTIDEFLKMKDLLFNNYIKKMLICYSKLDKRNINGRVSLLYSINQYLEFEYYTINNIPNYCTKSILYLQQFSNLNIKINFKEISIMEMTLTIMMNIIYEHLYFLK